MFNILKKKLKSLKEEVVVGQKGVKVEDTSRGDIEKPSIGIMDKAKTLLVERQLVLSEKNIEKVLSELYIGLLESDVAVEVADKICDEVRERLTGEKKELLQSTGELVEDSLRGALHEVLDVGRIDFDALVKNGERPFHILFVGVNGTGKTTSIAKVAHYLMKEGYSVVMAAGDTYRAGAIQQLVEHADRLNVKTIKHQPGGDPAAVLYDALAYARARGVDVVLSDTAGRMHTNVNLMEQLSKICRVAPPSLTIFVDDATAGNDAVERAKQFLKVTDFDCTMLTKLDADIKGGCAISIAYETGRPIIFFGVGQGYEDIVRFDADWLLSRIFD